MNTTALNARIAAATARIVEINAAIDTARAALNAALAALAAFDCADCDDDDSNVNRDDLSGAVAGARLEIELAEWDLDRVTRARRAARAALVDALAAA